MGRGPRFLLLAAVAGLTVAACNNGAGDQTQGPIAVGMTSNMMSSYNDGLTAMYEVQTPVRLPVRPPTGQEASAAAPAGTPYPHAPFLTAADEQIEVHYTLSNVDDQEQAVWLLIYPWNEFARWKPGITVVNDEESLPNFGYDQYFVIPAKSRLQGTITTDDMHEIAIKLATVENLLAKSMGMGGGSMMMYGQQDPTTLANHIMNPQNRSNAGDPLYAPIPPVIAGIIGFDLGLRTQTASGGPGANIAVEITIDLVDVNGGKFNPANSGRPVIDIPPYLSPPGAM